MARGPERVASEPIALLEEGPMKRLPEFDQDDASSVDCSSSCRPTCRCCCWRRPWRESCRWSRPWQRRSLAPGNSAQVVAILILLAVCFVAGIVVRTGS